METEAGVEITLFQEEYRKWREKEWETESRGGGNQGTDTAHLEESPRLYLLQVLLRHVP